jgi:hypothetical protein
MGGYAFGLERQAALARVTGDSLHGDGPFIISPYRPLEAPNSLTTPYIFEDLSSVPPDVVEFWVQQFKCQKAQERSWDKETVSSVALRLRTAIAIFALGLPEVKKAVAQWIEFVVNP